MDGATESTYTSGAPCVKGLTYPRRVISPDRIKYPDDSGWPRWRQLATYFRIEAMQKLAHKMLEIKRKTWLQCLACAVEVFRQPWSDGLMPWKE